ncbi:hypothetical protein [Corallococcus sp. AS-1-12]|uniref:hypothetical protein n=1 Tax=Corallococcus sp. AS-1-12 TaxID=2874598 RepID=UPI001CBF8989|nr:hypothetical protein [Corallococcus sp. AS-1-12]MBZ4335956.1 hypothetical protein [Corallococcus sp. AS-1-12]
MDATWKGKYVRVLDGEERYFTEAYMDVAQRCPAFPRVRSSGIQIYTVSAWPALDASNSSQLGPYGLCWTNGTYNFSVSVPNSDWTALTP